MGWNGLDLINDFSAELGDVGSGFKTKVLRWINEGIRDICTAHNWPFLREKGKIVLVANEDTHSIVLARPSAPTLAALAGGSLVADVSYRVLVTFFEAKSKVESIAGEYASITPSGTDLAITVSDIPVSTSPLVTARNIYVSKNSGAFQYHGQIGNNLSEIPGADPEVDPPTPVTYEITTDPSSVVTPPDENVVHMLDGDLFIEGEWVLKGTSVQDLKYSTSSITSNGTPTHWAPVNEEEVLLYPVPSAEKTVSFYYFKRPARVFGTVTSTPQMPSWLYEDLRRYVLWRGYDFRDRAGKESKQSNYENGLRLTISRRGKAVKKSGRVRVMTPDSDGKLS